MLLKQTANVFEHTASSLYGFKASANWYLTRDFFVRHNPRDFPGEFFQSLNYLELELYITNLQRIFHPSYSKAGYYLECSDLYYYPTPLVQERRGLEENKISSQKASVSMESELPDWSSLHDSRQSIGSLEG